MAKKLHTINVDDKVWKQARLEIPNMSQAIQTFLENYIETGDLEKIEVKIATLEVQISTLYTKKLQLIKNKTRDEQKNKIYQKIRSGYFIQRRNEQATDMATNDLVWLADPEVIKICEILKIKPEIILSQLKKDFEELEAKLHIENTRKS